MFDIDTLTDKVDGETLAKLRAHVTDLSTRAETAEEKARKAAKESIDGRKALKAERDRAFEKLGIETADELDAIQDAKGQAEASKQFDAQVKKLQRENAELKANSEAVGGQLKGMRREQALTSATDGLKFKTPADVRVLLQSRVVEEGDDLMFKTDDGKLVPLKDGAAWFAKTRPDYVQADSAGGKGSGFTGAAQGGKAAGDFGGDKASRLAAISNRFPELATAS